METIETDPTEPKETRVVYNACWRLNEAQVFKFCPALHAECYKELGYFLLDTNPVEMYEEFAESLFDYLRDAHKRFGIKLDRKLWINEFVDTCLDVIH
jgi:hypothetical protein